MEKSVHLTVAVPDRVYLKENVASVILPAVRADVNILPDRAPSIFVLDFGVLQILNANGSLKQRYFVQSGVAEIADNNCKVMIQGILPFDDINPHMAKKRVEAAENEQDRLFYQMILDYLRGIRRRYLRTLNLFSDKSGLPKSHEEIVADIKAEIEELKQRGKEHSVDEGEEA